MILCYRKSNQITSFLHTMEQINKQNEIHIILGDFNINIIEGNQRNYTQIGNEPTHTSSSLIDHVYIQNSFLEPVNATSQVVVVHFSEYDAVRFCSSNKLCD